MVGYLRALAADFDGTLTRDGSRPDDAVLAAIRRIRAGGVRVLLVTGRILAELREVFPDVTDHVDAIVAENGCVLVTSAGERPLAAAIDPRLAQRLGRRGIEVRAGEVLLAGTAADRAAVLDEIHELQLDCQLVFNRSELMILPSGVNKGTGLYEALGDLGVSRHSTVAVGDAENDRALLDLCEVGVAVSDSVDSLRQFADLVLSAPDGDGIVGLLTGLMSPDAPALHSPRWRIRLGSAQDGATAAVPSSQLNVMVCGRPGTGKSHLTGLLAERLIAQGYCVLVVDPEGDHQGLGRLRGVVVVDGQGGLPAPDRLTAIFSQRFTSVVLDLSQVAEAARHPYLSRLTDAIERSRRHTGLPHWIIADEAHSTFGALRGGAHSGPERWGFCLATYRPDLIEPPLLDRMDAVVLMGSGESPPGNVVDMVARVASEDASLVRAQLRRMELGHAYLAVRVGIGTSMPFRVASRVTEHQRHWHKYADAALPEQRRFFFRDERDDVVGVAGNLREFQAVLGWCDPAVVEHHALGHDFSRWFDHVFSDLFVARQLEELEDCVADHDIAPPQARERIIASVRRSYGV